MDERIFKELYVQVGRIDCVVKDRPWRKHAVFTYLLRAETPGIFSALPARAELIYQPSISGNSGDTPVEIREKR